MVQPVAVIGAASVEQPAQPPQNFPQDAGIFGDHPLCLFGSRVIILRIWGLPGRDWIAGHDETKCRPGAPQFGLIWVKGCDHPAHLNM
jgi:hypothetical protein